MSMYAPLPSTSTLPFYFSDDYPTCRERFLSAALDIDARLERLFLNCEEGLSIDLAYIGPLNPRKLIVHTSGTHGVGGFAGSAAQFYILTHLPPPPKDTAYLFIHGANPWGMRHLRRVNENNVDLNCNYVYYKNEAAVPQEAIRPFESLITPSAPPTFWTRCKLTLDIAAKRFYHGIPAMQQVFNDGQYTYPTGIFFGGSRLEESPAKLMAALEKYVKGIQELVLIDFHTGGPNVLYDDTIQIQADDEGKLRERFQERAHTLDFSRGTYCSAIARLVDAAVKKQIFVQEVPTIYPKDPSKCFTSFLLRTIEENQGYHFGLSASATQSHFRAFNRKTEEWQEKVLRVAYDAFFKVASR